MVKGNNGEENDGVEQCRISCEFVGLKDDQTWPYMVKLLFTNIQFLFVCVCVCVCFLLLVCSYLFMVFIPHGMLFKVPWIKCVFWIVISKAKKILHQREVNVNEDRKRILQKYMINVMKASSRILMMMIMMSYTTYINGSVYKHRSKMHRRRSFRWRMETR